VFEGGQVTAVNFSGHMQKNSLIPKLQYILAKRD